MLLTALGLYIATQLMFLGAWPGFEKRLQLPAPLATINTVGVSFCIGLIVLALGTLALELIAPRAWVSWSEHTARGSTQTQISSADTQVLLGRWTGVFFFVPAGWISMALLLAGWAMGPLIIRGYHRATEYFWHQRDRFSMTVGLLFWLFVFAGLTLLFAGLVQRDRYQFNALVPGTTSYTALIASLGALMWTLFPLAKLMSLFQSHIWRREGRCLTCGYDLRASKREPDAACPECGAVLAE